MSRGDTVKRSRIRRAGESAYGLLLLAKIVLLNLVVLLVLAGGVWKSWETARHVVAGGDAARGAMTVSRCIKGTCTGPFLPEEGGGGAKPTRVTVDEAVTHELGERLPVAVRPGTDEALRTGTAGVLYAWTPLGGALLLVSLVVAGGLRMPRTALAVAALGGGQIAAAFMAL